ncbi:hypothetical protein PYS58_02715 [Chryseobacterium indologenes]|uniref:hypothetical protein n=1 Tax=Chryseobacterium indologenes TaxID=253 RepID=UPI0023E81AB3|nr:hypothetical protein [Chryseobacterium indologenes]WET50044.1 hypothetical protein PYS58_02715 [Chryseobacterium indologenes]
MECILLNSILTLGLFITILSCTTQKKLSSIGTNPYKIEKIDSVNNHYIILISNENKLYKVISERVQSKCHPIKIDGRYPSFMFKPLINEQEYIPKDRPANYLDFVPNEVKLNDGTIVKKEVGIDNIYSTPNLDGLCYKELTPMLKK